MKKAELGCVELLFKLLERSLSGHLSAKLRFHCAQCLQYISIEDDLRGKVGGKSHISIILRVIYNINNGHSVKGELFGILMNLAANELGLERVPKKAQVIRKATALIVSTEHTRGTRNAKTLLI